MIAVAWFGRQESAERGDAIVVLGAAQYAGRPSPVLRARLDHAFELWQRRRAPLIILTGGQGDGDTTSEAEVGRTYLNRRGVPQDVMLVETKGRSTDESLAGVSALMRSRGVSRVVLVSDPFHMLRLRLLCWQRHIDATGSPTQTSPISQNRTEALQYVVSESVKVPASIVLAAWHAWVRS